MDNALALIQGWIQESPHRVTVIPRTDRLDGCETVLGITEHSVLGSLINHTGGLSVDNGRIRHLGGNNQFHLSLSVVNEMKDKKPTRFDGVLIVAIDIFGGLFGINFNPSVAQPGAMLYLPPESYGWYHMKIGHSDFVRWSMTDRTDKFYQDFQPLQYPTDIPFYQVLSFTPPLWAADLAQGKFRSSLQQMNKTISIRAGMLQALGGQ